MENKLKIQFLYEVLETEISNENLKETAINDLNFIKERLEKLEQAIELLKDMFNINLWVDDMDCYIRIGKCDYLISLEQYTILSEVLV